MHTSVYTHTDVCMLMCISICIYIISRRNITPKHIKYVRRFIRSRQRQLAGEILRLYYIQRLWVMYIYIFYVHISMHTSVYSHLYTHINIHKLVCTFINTNQDTHINIYTYQQSHIISCTSTNKSTTTYQHTIVNTHIEIMHIEIHTNIHTNT